MSEKNEWKLVPVDRTYDMRVKAIRAFNTAEQAGKDRDDALDAAFQAMLAAAPCPTCNDRGAVGNILNAEPCPDCTPASVAPGDAQDERQPLFWYRPRSDGGYEGPIHNESIEEARKQSGAWVPLYDEVRDWVAILPKPHTDMRYHGEFVRGWNQCLQAVLAALAAQVPQQGEA